jgi:aryl-alcohol dehydrogenase-like predicted oxidoreductase
MMAMRDLGSSGLKVSQISMGTVALGMDYGLSGPMQACSPTEVDAVRLLNEALERGINFFDTAPAYGRSEQVVGRAIGHRREAIIATKVSIPTNNSGQLASVEATRRVLQASLSESRSRLRRDCLDVVQVHNASLEMLQRGDVTEVLLNARDNGMVRCLGASVYTEEEALAVIASGCFDLVQVAYNILDQRMATRVLPAAESAGVGVIIRSAFLKGVLTPRGQWLGAGLEPLAAAAGEIVECLSLDWESLPIAALRFCASASQDATVLVGVQNTSELQAAVQAMSLGPFSRDKLDKLRTFAMGDEHLLNPGQWPRESVVN